MAFLSRVLGNSAAHGNPLLSGAFDSSAKFGPEGGNFDEGVGQSWGAHMFDNLPTTEYMGMEKVPANFNVSIEDAQLGVLSEDELSLAASGGLSEE